MNIDIRQKLCRLAVDAVSYEWGSDEQIDAENEFFSLSGDAFGIDWEEHSYLSRATTEEMIEYAIIQIDGGAK